MNFSCYSSGGLSFLLSDLSISLRIGGRYRLLCGNLRENGSDSWSILYRRSVLYLSAYARTTTGECQFSKSIERVRTVLPLLNLYIYNPPDNPLGIKFAV